MPCIINRLNIARAGTVMWGHRAIAAGGHLQNEGAKRERRERERENILTG